jgi:hypothetical protein
MSSEERIDGKSARRQNSECRRQETGEFGEAGRLSRNWLSWRIGQSIIPEGEDSLCTKKTD